jgi:hypothetical protein
VRCVVIVGASLAGLRAAQAARAAGFDGDLVMVGEEPHLPYTRPPLSKEVLAGEHEAESVHFPCDTLDAQWRLGVSATSLDRARRRVVLSDGDELAYDRVILATGSRARRWAGAGGELEGVRVLRNLDDGYIPPVFEAWHGMEVLDRKRVVRPRESLEWTRRLVNECGIFAGISSGAALAGAAKVASEIDEGTIVFIVCDGGWKYLSTGAYTDDLDVAEARAEQIIYF